MRGDDLYFQVRRGRTGLSDGVVNTRLVPMQLAIETGVGMMRGHMDTEGNHAFHETGTEPSVHRHD